MSVCVLAIPIEAALVDFPPHDRRLLPRPEERIPYGEVNTPGGGGAISCGRGGGGARPGAD